VVAEQLGDHQVGDIQSRRLLNEFAHRAAIDEQLDFALLAAEQRLYRTAGADQRHRAIDLAQTGLHRFNGGKQFLQFKTARRNSDVSEQWCLRAVERNHQHQYATRHIKIERIELQHAVCQIQHQVQVMN